jgi:tetratricopeptide (TPR) repeat protein
MTESIAEVSDMKPLCFALMPFGRKTDESGRMIDFDIIYQQIIAPAIIAADMEPMRADQERMGGAIHKAMFERLLLREYAVADVTGANPNVFYELGIRHATRPRSTVILFAEGTALPFDVALLRCVRYETDSRGVPVEPKRHLALIKEKLKEAQQDTYDDSPLFQLVDGMPRISLDRERMDSFRGRMEELKNLQAQLRLAGRAGKRALQALTQKAALGNLADLDPGFVVDLFISYGEVRAYEETIEFYKRMPSPLRRGRAVQERLSLAYMRLQKHDDAERVLRRLLEEAGPSSEAHGLLGNLYTDRWEALRNDQEGALAARGFLRRAINEYVKGFMVDWRDPFPGNNAIMLMEIQGPPFEQRDELLPVVAFSAKRRAEIQKDFWGYGNLLQMAVITRNKSAAEEAAEQALATYNGEWQAETAAHNLRLLRENRAGQGEDVVWIGRIEMALVEAERRRVARWHDTSTST